MAGSVFFKAFYPLTWLPALLWLFLLTHPIEVEWEEDVKGENETQALIVQSKQETVMS